MSKSADRWRHSHQFDEGNPLAERNSRWAMWLTLIMMAAEIMGGWYYNSMALLADGWHMSSHALALGLAVAAYRAARRYSHDNRFAFGTWKIEILAGYTSAILLVGVAGLMLLESVERLLDPSPIHYDQAIGIAAIGLVVNLACAWLLKASHEVHHHSHEAHDEAHQHDLNQRSAYLHVLADAATSVLAIVALAGGKYRGLDWLDPVMGMAGAVLVALWAYGLLQDTGRILLDAEMDAPLTQEIQDALRHGHLDATITDLHVWRVGKNKYACIVSMISTPAMTPDKIRQLLSVHEELVHITVEINVPDNA